MKLARILSTVVLCVCTQLPALSQETHSSSIDKAQRDGLLDLCSHKWFADSNAEKCQAVQQTTDHQNNFDAKPGPNQQGARAPQPAQLRPKEPAADAELAREREGGRPEESHLTPPQSLLDYVKKAVEAHCAAVKDKEPNQTACVDRIVNSEKARQFQFLVGNRLPDAADYGWLMEFNTNDCEANAACDVSFLVPLVKGTISGAPNPEYSSPNDLSFLAAAATVEDARRLKNGWWCALSFKGNLQSVSLGSGNGTSLSPYYQTTVLSMNGHTWQYFAEKGFYYDQDEYQAKLAKIQKEKDDEQQAKFRRNSEWLRKTILALPLQFGQSQALVKGILWRSGFHYSGLGGTPWVCESSGWQINQSDILAKQGVVQDLMTSCVTEYKQGNNGMRLILAFELGQRKRNPDRGTIYEVSTDRLVMTIADYQNPGGDAGSGGLSTQIKRMSAHDCKITNQAAEQYDNGEVCIPF